MKRPTPAPAPTPRTLAQQQSDFTSEGAPPPGKVATDAPQTKDAPAMAQPREPVAARGPLMDTSGKSLVRRRRVRPTSR